LEALIERRLKGIFVRHGGMVWVDVIGGNPEASAGKGLSHRPLS
jgi:hypothetical protein